MKYTVKGLAKISGVTVRTLHWYDKQNLLKPSYYGANGYRYYEEKQLLLLQQILFFKELEFSLQDIQKLLKQDDFDKIIALQAHRSSLRKDIERKNHLLNTIDKTILHLEGHQTLPDKELYYGFGNLRQKEYKQYFIRYRNEMPEKNLRQSKECHVICNKQEWDKIKTQGCFIHNKLTKAMEAGLAPDSDEVQKIIHYHHRWQGRFYAIASKATKDFTTLYIEKNNFEKVFHEPSPKIKAFINRALQFYTDKNL